MRARSAMALMAMVRRVKKRKRQKANTTHKNKGLIRRFFQKMFESKRREAGRTKDTNRYEL